jgi:hypothetical protein
VNSVAMSNVKACLVEAYTGGAKPFTSPEARPLILRVPHPFGFRRVRV